MATKYLKNHFRLTSGLQMLLISFSGWAENPESTQKKEINQSFSVSLSDQLNVENRYGAITITHWAKNEVAIRVVVESKARNDEQAQKGLDRVKIELKKSGSTVHALTSFVKQSGWESNNSSIAIDYYISMPSKLAANLSQQYGNINLPENNEGRCSLEVKYGNIKAGSFSESLRIEAGYSNINIEDVKDLRMHLAYSGNTSLRDAQNLTVDSKYSNLNIRNADKARIDNGYGNVKIQSANVLSIDTRYGNANIIYVKEELNVGTLSYSTLTLTELNAGFKHVNAEARYGTLILSISPQAAFQVIAEDMRYGSVDIKGMKITNSTIDNKVYHHYQINGGGDRFIRFEGNSYSNLKINAL